MVNKKSKRKLFKFLLLIVLSAIIFTGLIGAITFQQIAPTTNPFITPLPNVTISTGVHCPDGCSSFTESWNGTNTTLYDYQLINFLNFQNLSVLGEYTNGSTEALCGKVRDLSLYNLNGTVLGCNSTAGFVVENITWGGTFGKFGGAFNFSGNSNQIYVADNAILDTNATTIAFWAKVTGQTQVDLVRKFENSANQRTWQFYTVTGLPRFRVSSIGTVATLHTDNEYVTGTTNLSDDTWHFIAGTYNLTHLTLYVDGVQEATIAWNKGLFVSTAPIRIGATLSGGNLNGSIDELMIWNVSKSSDFINQLYKSSLQRYNLTYWEYNITKSTSVYSQDSSLCSKNLTGVEFCTSNQAIRKQANIIQSNFSTSKGVLINNFYGTNSNAKWFGRDTYLDITNNGTRTYLANEIWNRQEFLNSGMTYFRMPMELQGTNSAFTSDLTYFNGLKDMVEWAYNNNLRILVTPIYVPADLVNTTSGYCNTTGVNPNITCTPSNFTAYGDRVVQAIDYITNNGLWNNTIEIEVWNEPYSGTFLNNLSYDNLIKGVEYVKVYNATYIAIKTKYPSIPVGGSSDQTEYQNIRMAYLSNMTTNMDFITTHPYSTTYTSSEMLDLINEVFTNCTTYSANCSRIIISEWNVLNSSIQNTSSLFNNYGSEIISSYIDIMNIYPNNITSIFYTWSQEYRYNNTANYPEYPYLWEMITQNELLVTGQPQYKIPYNVTKNFAHIHPSGADVKVTSSDSSCLKQVASIKGSLYALTIINTCNEAVNVTANLTNNTNFKIFPYTSLQNYEDGSSIPVSSQGIIQLGVLDSYEVLYLTSGDEDGGTLVNLFKLNEYTGSVVYDALFGTSNGTRSGATWVTDGVLRTLTSVTDYVFSGDGILTLTSSNIFSYLLLNWDLSSVSVLRENFTAGVDVISGKIPLLFLVLIVGVILMVLGGLTALFYLLMKKVPSRFSGGV